MLRVKAGLKSDKSELLIFETEGFFFCCSCCILRSANKTVRDTIRKLMLAPKNVCTSDFPCTLKDGIDAGKISSFSTVFVNELFAAFDGLFFLRGSLIANLIFNTKVITDFQLKLEMSKFAVCLAGVDLF